MRALRNRLAFPSPGLPFKETIAFDLTAIFCIVVGARLWLIEKFGSSLPINDQWGEEGFAVLKPWFEGTLRFADLFSPHNEHRIFVSRILALGLAQLNGQWDTLLELVVDAIFCGLIAIAVTVALRDLFDKRYRFLVLTTVTLWLTLPYAQENTLWGFQSSFYFLLFFSLLGIWGLGLHPPFSVRWCAGGIGAVLACLSMGSGFFAAVAVLGLVMLRLIERRSTFRESIATIVVACSIIAISLYFRHPVPQHDFLKAISLSAWLVFFGRCLAWPFSQNAVVAILTQLPLVLLALRYLSGDIATLGPKMIRLAEGLLGTGLWVALQAAAIAYTRGGEGHGAIASRYMDVLALGSMVNLFALLLVLTRMRPAYRWRKWAVLASAIWAGALLIGAGLTSYQEVISQYGRQSYLRSAAQHVRAYLATGDRKYLEGEPHPVPYPDVSALASFLDDPTIRDILPTAARLPLRVEESPASGGAFIPNGYPAEITNPAYERSWGSYSALGKEARGSLESKSLRPRLPFLEFELAGYLRPGLSLNVRGDHNGRERRFIPTTQVEPYWRSGILARPDDTVRIIAHDDNAEDWFAFREPRELGRFSYYAEKVVAKGKLLFYAGIAVSLLLGLRHARSRRINLAPDSI